MNKDSSEPVAATYNNGSGKENESDSTSEEEALAWIALRLIARLRRGRTSRCS
jgi:hypothetical protein